MASFNVSILLKDKKLLESQDASSLVMPTTMGYMGVLAHHAPIVALLAPGDISLKMSSGEIKKIRLQGGGFFEFADNKATLLLDSGEF